MCAFAPSRVKEQPLNPFPQVRSKLPIEDFFGKLLLREAVQA